MEQDVKRAPELNAPEPDDDNATARRERRSHMVIVNPAHPPSGGDSTAPATFKHLEKLPAVQAHNNTNTALLYLAVSDRFFRPMSNSSTTSGQPNDRSKRGGA